MDSSIATEAQALVNSFVDTDAVTDYDGSAITTKVQALIHSSVGKDAPTNIACSSIATEAQALNVNVSTKAPPSDDLKLVKEEKDLLVAHIQLDDKETFEFYVSSFNTF